MHRLTSVRVHAQLTDKPHRVCIALDDSPSSMHALDWALANLVRPAKDELFLISVTVEPELEPVRSANNARQPPIRVNKCMKRQCSAAVGSCLSRL